MVTKINIIIGYILEIFKGGSKLHSVREWRGKQAREVNLGKVGFEPKTFGRRSCA